MNRAKAGLMASVVLLATVPAYAANVIIRTSKPYDAVKAKVAALGGTVTHEFKHANGIAVSVPDSKVNSLSAIKGVQYYVRDLVIPAPQAKQVVPLDAQVEGLGGAALMPADYYSYGSEQTGAYALQNSGYDGTGIVVGVIDTGINQQSTVLCDDPSSPANCAATSRVLGGQSFVAGEPNAIGAPLGDHGTWVASTIGAFGGFLFNHSGTLATALRTYCNPLSDFPCALPFSATQDLVFMIGQAPFAQFYAFKVFPAAGGGASTSTVMAAMDAAIDVKNTTQPNMRVVNMSLGGETLFAGGDIEDELASSMAASGISLVVSAGNAGPSGSTVGSPGTALNILTAGAGSDPVNERVLRDVQFAFNGIGGFYRPDDNQQMADFSSRGPDADGRIDPDIIANGFATFAQSATNGLSLVSGTSFSAPTISGVVADLYTFAPWATPAQIRNALLSTANATKVPTATPVDQGKGYVDAVAAALALGTAPLVPDLSPGSPSVRQNVATLAGITPIDSVDYTAAIGPLRPAERREVYYVVKKGTAAVHVSLTGITPENAPDDQNLLFGDDIELAIHSAKTSSIGEGDYLVPLNFYLSDQSFTLTDLDTGLIRVTVMGDTTNAGRVSANLHITEDSAPQPKKTFKGKIAEGQEQVFSVALPAGLTSVKFSTSWLNDWGSFPTNDLDMIVLPPSGPANTDGATINSPERATIANPAAGTWTIIVDGFTVFNKSDNFEVRVDY